MKKFMKNSAILALVLIFAGVLMIAVVGVLKGPEVVAGAGKIVNRLDSGVRFQLESDMDGLQQTDGVMEIFTDELKKLNVEIGAGELCICPSEDENIYLHREGTGTYQSYVSEGTLYLKTSGSAGVGAAISGKEDLLQLNVQIPECRLTLFVPQDFRFEEVKMEIGAGSVKNMGAFRADRIDIELAAGEMELDKLQVETLLAKVGAGSLSFGGALTKEAEIVCGMGEVGLQLSGNEKDFNYNVKVAAGEVIVGEDSFDIITGTRSIDNQASKK